MPSRASTFATLIPSLVAALAGTAVAVPPLPFPAAFELSSLDGDNGFLMHGISHVMTSGFSVSSAGDVNGDGIDDLIIGAWELDVAGAGESYVVFGKSTPFAASLDLSTLNGTNGFVINGIDTLDRAGFSVSSAGDVNGDGIGDLIIGAPRAGPNGRTYAGESYVVFGQTTGFAASLSLSTLNGTNGFVINGIDAGDQSGTSVSSAGDVNGDGIGDLTIGAFGAIGYEEAYVIFGRAPEPCTGDANGDGDTDVSDFNIMASNFGAGPGATAAQGDLSGDGFVNVSDFNIVAGDFGCGL